jgi:hypothetical protein
MFARFQQAISWLGILGLENRMKEAKVKIILFAYRSS